MAFDGRTSSCEGHRNETSLKAMIGELRVSLLEECLGGTLHGKLRKLTVVRQGRQHICILEDVVRTNTIPAGFKG